MPSERRYADVLRELQAHGWTHVRTTGSHHIFEKPGETLLSIPVKKNKVKPCYESKIKRACGKR